MFEQLSSWASNNGHLLAWLGGISALMFVATLLLIPVLVARIPVDYFSTGHQRVARTRDQHPLLYWAGLVLRNVLGLVFIIAGIAMLVLPGQGILSILIGVSLSSFPGKYTLERKLVSLPKVLDGINWLRAKSDKPPLQTPLADQKRTGRQ